MTVHWLIGCGDWPCLVEVEYHRDDYQSFSSKCVRRVLISFSLALATTQVNQNGSVYGRVSGRSNADRTIIKFESDAGRLTWKYGGPFLDTVTGFRIFTSLGRIWTNCSDRTVRITATTHTGRIRPYSKPYCFTRVHPSSDASDICKT